MKNKPTVIERQTNKEIKKLLSKIKKLEKRIKDLELNRCTHGGH